MVAVAKLSSRYSVMIPAEVRERHSLRPGDEVAFLEDEHGLRIVRVPTFAELRGIFASRATVAFERDKDRA